MTEPPAADPPAATDVSASPRRRWLHRSGAVVLSAGAAVIARAQGPAGGAARESRGARDPRDGRHRPGFEHPFAADSPWNLRPQRPVLGTHGLPVTRFAPFVGPGAYSTGVFRASPGDPPMRVTGAPGSPGLFRVDEGEYRDLVLPHWPADLRAATGDDGHADLIDEASGRVHSFWQLRRIDGRWCATSYAWSALAGRGWPDPAHPSGQASRPNRSQNW